MIEKLQKIKERFDFITAEMLKPELMQNMNEYRKLAKEHNSLTPIIEAYDEYCRVQKDFNDAKKMLETEKDKDMAEMLQAEIDSGRDRLDELTEELKVLLLPKDPNDDKNVIVEIRAGAGGEEASLFAYELRRMYFMYAESKRWKIEVLDNSETELGGVKECSFLISGNGVYSMMKFESGVHRVQRVPATESQGRVHTSTATVAVLPEAEEIDIEIKDDEIKVDTYRSGGAGGQHVNKTESAIRITHLPTGIVVACQEERSQIQNREKAMALLRAKINDFFQTQADKEYADNRKNQVGTGDRSERIRTYNFPQGRVSDHRIGLTLYTLTNFINGDLDEMIEALRQADQIAKLKSTDD